MQQSQTYKLRYNLNYTHAFCANVQIKSQCQMYSELLNAQ